MPGCLYLPPYSPDMNPIEMAFSKLKALLRARALRTIEALWNASAICCMLLTHRMRHNFLRHGIFLVALVML